MKKYGLVVDSTLTVTLDIFEENNILVAKFKVLIDGEPQPLDVSNEAVVSAIKADKEVKTSQPAPEDYLKTYQQHFGNGAEVVLCFTISKSLSGSFNSAKLAVASLPAEYQDKVYVFDTESVSVGSRYYLLKAIEFLNAGMSPDQTMIKLEQLKNQGYLLFMVDDLDTLKKGGRLGKVKYFIANILKIKPILRFKRGELEISNSTARGQVRAVRFLINKIIKEQESHPHNKIKVILANVDQDSEALEIVNIMNLNLPNIPVEYGGRISQIVTSHIGPGGVGIYVYYE